MVFYIQVSIINSIGNECVVAKLKLKTVFLERDSFFESKKCMKLYWQGNCTSFRFTTILIKRHEQ